MTNSTSEDELNLLEGSVRGCRGEGLEIALILFAIRDRAV